MRRKDQVGEIVEAYQAREINRRQFLQRAMGVGLSFGAASALLAACGGDEGGGAGTGAEEGAPSVSTDQLRVHLDEDIENLDPAINPGHTDTAVSTNIFENLVVYRPDSFEVVNELAETFEPSEDGLRYDFKLKEGIQFHGGYGELTADDVKFSYERIAGLTKPKIESAYSADWAALEVVEVNDKYSGTIVLKEPFAPLMTTTLPVQAGQIVSKKAVEERGERFGTEPIGTGPYEFVEWQRNQHVLLRQFAEYGGAAEYVEKPPWKEIRFVVIAEDNPTAIALETGELDFAVLATTEVSRFQENADFEVIEKTTLNYNWIGMNVEHENLKDKNVRLAVINGIDVPSIIEAAFDGRWTRATAIIPPGMPLGHWEDAPVYERNLEQAQEYLAQAGAEGLQLEMTVSDGEEGAATVAEIVQANLNEVGFDVQVVVQEGGVFGLNEPEANAKKQLFYTGFTTNPDPSWSTVWFTCDQVGVWNWMSWCNDEYSRLDREAARETDEQKRTEMYIRMQELMDEDAVALWVAWPTEILAARKGIKPAIQPDGGYHAWAFTPAA
jgi:peptide/nickel transport system substrate-binding protein